jgi:hypothetical protein
MPLCNKGDAVVWESQSAGSTTRKEGVVVAVAADDPHGYPVHYAKREFPGHKLMFDGLLWHPDGVLVEVRDGKTARAKPKLYMPIPSKIGRPM